MKSAKSKQHLTLLVLRDAQHAVKQIQISKPLLIAVPTVAILCLSGLIVSMQVHSSQVITKMEKEITSQTIANMQMELTVNNREEAILRLKNEIVNLSSEADDMKSKMTRVSELEKELQKFIKKHDISMLPQSTETRTVPLSLDASKHVGGEYIAIHHSEILDLSQETKDDFEQMRKLLDTMEHHIPDTLEKAQETQKIISGTPNAWPTVSKVLTSSFGYRSDPFTGKAAFHAGIDIVGQTGDPIYAAGAGQVLSAEQSGARGLYIVIQHPEGLQTSYMHMSNMNVSPGDQVSKGDVIGEMGSTGRSTGSHLHFQVMKHDKVINPLPYID
ncbi:M23 family metallopeptidase [Paenibacillus sp. IHBB 10380]|uniref:M23 family metallopeptidase n=1 Tax=Paenibacillus sp. IHBB 10380 TaxID=1566358 RepID=UPI0005CFE660|nr:peptidoglycan DD-metalloendopeptidase family protein [Paenibacillus sp. IHBB 10380]AJS60025.1 membrane protein [Paenibacillus sp. IHBB 10380]